MDSAPALRRDALVAALLALVLGLSWAWRDWANLSAMRLPDTDDVVRLQQIRDWLAGQPFNDVGQYRLAGGLQMHWSRLPDLVPGALIALLTPLVGQHGAEMAAVIAWPLMLFATALLLIARIARALGVEAGTATAVAALAWPATTLFMPGRIDHHGLQMVLLLGAVLAQVRAPSAGAGVAAGLLAAASLAIGLETMPLFAALGAAAVVEWVAGRADAARRMEGLGVGALVGLAAAKGLFATTAWDFPACDGFTGEAWRAAVALAPVPLVLALADGRLTGWRWRVLAAIGAGAVAGGVALALSPGCLSPYRGIDPVLTRLWLREVGEAQALFAAAPGMALAYAGLMIVGLGCSVFACRASRGRPVAWGWATLLACQIAALLVTVTALRGAYAGALLAAPALAAAIAAERTRGVLRLARAWAVAAGLLYPLAAQAWPSPRTALPAFKGDCASPAMLQALRTLPVGVVMAPVDAGAYLLAGSPHQVIAAPYHRNNAGNRAAYAFYLDDETKAATVAQVWRVRYALGCAAMPGLARAVPLPGWYALATLPDGAVIYASGL